MSIMRSWLSTELIFDFCSNVGIGVDLHVERITNRLGWHHPPTNGNAEKARYGKQHVSCKALSNTFHRMNLESWLPREKWANINHMLVGFGQVCTKLQGN
jgi:endonuclease-3